MNHSHYTLPHAECNLLRLLNSFYPSDLEVLVINEEDQTQKERCLLKEVKNKKFPLIVVLVYRIRTIFYKCFPEKEAKIDIDGLTLNNFNQTFNTKLIDKDFYHAKLFKISKWQSYLAIDENTIVSMNDKNEFILLTDDDIPAFDLEDGFFHPNDKPIDSEFNKKFYFWIRNNLKGNIFS